MKNRVQFRNIGIVLRPTEMQELCFADTMLKGIIFLSYPIQGHICRENKLIHNPEPKCTGTTNSSFFFAKKLKV